MGYYILCLIQTLPRELGAVGIMYIDVYIILIGNDCVLKFRFLGAVFINFC